MLKITTKIELSPLVWARLTIMSAVSLILISLLFFLYRDFYQTIIQAETVLVLKREVALRDIEMNLFQRVKYINDLKIKNILPADVPDAFGTSAASAPLWPEASTQ
ncbi:MAG: hypothetical protein AAB779_04150 [Patescibacteria group bacterium]